MVHMLTSLGHYDTDEASSGLKALKMLRMGGYDLLIKNLHMPNLNGEQLLAKVRSDIKLQDLPVLMVSCEGDKSKMQGMLQDL